MIIELFIQKMVKWLFLKTQSGVFKLLVLSDRQSKLQRLSLNKDMKENEGAANVHIREPLNVWHFTSRQDHGSTAMLTAMCGCTYTSGL